MKTKLKKETPETKDSKDSRASDIFIKIEDDLFVNLLVFGVVGLLLYMINEGSHEFLKYKKPAPTHQTKP